MIEAVMASAMIMAVLFYVNSAPLWPAGERAVGLGPLSSDLLNVLEYRTNSLEHPALGFALSSPAQWNDSSDELAGDIGRMLPAGTYYFVETPYGSIGQRPAAGPSMYVRPFVAYGGAGKMLDCKLTLWRA